MSFIFLYSWRTIKDVRQYNNYTKNRKMINQHKANNDPKNIKIILRLDAKDVVKIILD